MINVLGVVSGDGRSRDALVFVAGRDDPPPGPGANDNGSGTGALVELARTLVGSVTQTSLVFASVDGTTAESAGARELARHPPGGLRLRAGIALRGDRPRRRRPLVLRLSGEGHRLPAAGWLRTVEQALRDEGVQDVRLPSLGQQVAGLVAPVVHGDQAPLVGSGAAVVGIDGSRPGESSRGRHLPEPSSPPTCSAASARPRSSPRSPSTPGPRPASLGSTYLVSSDRVLRGWTLELFLVALLIPPVFALIDAAARARARGARPSITVRRVLWRAAGIALGVLAIRLAGRDGRPARHALAAVRRQRRAASRCGRSSSRWRSAAPCGALAARRVPLGRRHRRRRALPRRALRAARRRRRSRSRAMPTCSCSSSPPCTSGSCCPLTARLGAAARAAVVLAGWLGPAAVIALLAGAGGFGVDAPAWFVRLIGDGGIPLASSLALAILASATVELLWLVVAAGGGTRTGDGAPPQQG